MNQKYKKLSVVAIIALLAIPIVTSIVVAKNQCSDTFIAKVLGLKNACPGIASATRTGEVSFTDAAGKQVNLDLSELASFIAEEKKNGGVNFELSMSGNILKVSADNSNSRSVDLTEFANSVEQAAVTNPEGDKQILSVKGTIMTISGGNTIDLAPTLALADYYAGTGITISGSRVISTTLGTSIDNSEIEDDAISTSKVIDGAITTDKIADGTILFADLNDNDCQGGQIIKYSGTDWTCGTGINPGDVKSGMQSADHGGWIKLDGRAISSLTEEQQVAAQALGFTANLPNAANSFLVQNGTAIGSVSSSNTKTIDRNQLPNVTLGGSTSTNGAHSHSYTTNSTDGAAHPVAGGSRAFSTSDYGDTTSTNGAHSHTLTTDSINGNVTQQQLNVTPRSLSVNMFIYLGL